MNFADQEDLAIRQRQRQRQKRRDLFWNFLTVLTSLGILLLIGYFLLLFSNPHLSINPFPPPIVVVVAGASTPTAEVVPPPTSTVTPGLTEFPTATATLTQTPTVEPTVTATPRIFTPDANADHPYAIEGIPVALASTVFRADSGCAWQGVAGRVVDLQGRAVVGLIVRLVGSYGDEDIEMTTLTGGGQAWYGESGYEFYLGSEPLNTIGTLSVQLFDLESHPLSAKIYIDTFSTCEKNLVLVNYKQVR